MPTERKMLEVSRQDRGAKLTYFTARSKSRDETYTQEMKRKIDSDRGRMINSKRIGTAEPVFANIRHAMGLDRFALRGKKKVNIQGKLFCIVRNRSPNCCFSEISADLLATFS